MTTRDPSRVGLIELRYDRDWRYADNHFISIRAAAGRDFGPVPVQLATKGFQVTPAMAAGHAARFAERIEPGREVAKLIDPTFEFVAAALAPALDGPVGALARGFFRSDFVVTSLGSRRKVGGLAALTSTEKGSSHWHCDAGPTEHLKVILYLNARSEHNGGTAFIEKPATDVLKRAGYVFQPREERHFDMGEVIHSLGLPPSEHVAQPECGEAVVFRPSQVMHKAVIPTEGERITVTLLLLPSSAPWRDFLQANLAVILANDSAAFAALQPAVDIK